ncbi:hypothetical protein ZWY2020_014921 [Hordeum vulgare]|nr:hypothetical protein ZWY2020_014921 [Hordeum vulgare]
MDFLRSGIHFASVDITNDKPNMRRNFGIEIPAECHIDLQGLFQLEYPRTSMADMAAALIDEEYHDMKRAFPKSQHKKWGKTPLDPINIEYAAKDGYIAYELYQKD